MTYDQLVAFLAVADTGTFAAASEQLHKSQPAVSKLVSNLEEELGFAFFDRSGYRPTLTQAGQLFRQRAALVVEQTHALRRFARQLAHGHELLVRVVVDAVTPLAPVMRALAAVQAAHLSARIELRTETLSSALERITTGQADLGIVQTWQPLPQKFEQLPYDVVRVAPVAHVRHRLARHSGSISHHVLLDHVQVVLREGCPTDSGYSLNVLDGVPTWAVTDLAAKRQVIDAGMGWGGLPEPMVRESLAQGHLVELDIPDFSVRELPLALVRPHAQIHGPIADALWSALLQR